MELVNYQWLEAHFARCWEQVKLKVLDQNHGGDCDGGGGDGGDDGGWKDEAKGLEKVKVTWHCLDHHGVNVAR